MTVYNHGMSKKKEAKPVEATLEKQALNVELPAELLARLRRLAKKNKRKLNAEVELALEKHLAEEDPTPS